MILDVSDFVFHRIFQDESLYLPIRWDGVDFFVCLEELFHKYCRAIESESSNLCYSNKQFIFEDLPIKRVCSLIKRAVKHYLDGFPGKAYNSFARLMKLLQKRPLKIYNKSCYEIFETYDDRLNLFRVANVDNNIPYKRTRVFHTPYNLRSKVSTSRYSIAGYPSLYLGTSLELCCEELQYNPCRGYVIASKFKIDRNVENNDTAISVIELSLKPQDFLNRINHTESNRRIFDEIKLRDTTIRTAYLLWYPLIAACSFIRTNKNHPFAAEYIVPQLLMQWVRNEMTKKIHNSYVQLIGIRYFSCASEKASDMGFNYIFPVSGKQLSHEKPYCPILAKAFLLTKTYYINEYVNIAECERALINDNRLDYI